MSTNHGHSGETAALAARLQLSLALVWRRTRAEDAESRLSLAQLSILGRLDRCPGMTATDLAAAEGLRPQTVRNLVDELRDEGFIVGVRDSSDARRVKLSLTDMGRDWIYGCRGPSDRVLARILTEHLDEEERRTLIGAVALLERIAYR